uniref:3-methyl-2-oxobutanoate hydroxymethyltransferase n=1 Tax=Hanusia phi TaxID=3032 RepID=A0A7S0HR21_9CRYP
MVKGLFAPMANLRCAGILSRAFYHVMLPSKSLSGQIYSISRSAARASRLLTNGASRNFSGTSTKDIDSMNETELRAMVRKLMGASANKPSSVNTEQQRPAIMGAPENYVARPTKGEATSAGDEHSNITIVELKKMYSKNIPITMATAYDFPSAVHVDLAGIDVVLVGDSLGMVVLGYDTTLPVTFDEILHHCRAVSRGCKRPLLVGDLPFGSYEISAQEAQRNAYRLLKEGGMEAVKLEGADAGRLRTVETLVKGGIAVMGHIGLTPQSYSTLGGFRAQGKHAQQAISLIEQARHLVNAGVFAIVLECVPAEVAKEVTERISVPTIGIGAGIHTSGQVLVYHDLLGMMQHPHHAKVTPKFCKQFSSVGVTINEALKDFRREVRERTFPDLNYSPYKMASGELEAFRKMLPELDLKWGGIQNKVGSTESEETKVY